MAPKKLPPDVLKGAKQRQSQAAKRNNVFASPSIRVDTAQLKGNSSSAKIPTTSERTTGPKATTVGPVYSKKEKSASCSSERFESEDGPKFESASQVSTACDDGVELRVGNPPQRAASVADTEQHGAVSSTALLLNGLGGVSAATPQGQAGGGAEKGVARKQKGSVPTNNPPSEGGSKPIRSRKISKVKAVSDVSSKQPGKSTLVQPQLPWGSRSSKKLEDRGAKQATDDAAKGIVKNENKKLVLDADETQDTLGVFVAKETERVEVERFEREMENRIVPQVSASELICVSEGTKPVGEGIKQSGTNRPSAAPCLSESSSAQIMAARRSNAPPAPPDLVPSELYRLVDDLAEDKKPVVKRVAVETPPAEKAFKNNKREEFLKRAQEGKLSPFTLGDLSTFRGLHEGKTKGRHTSVEGVDDYIVQGAMQYANGRMNQFTAIDQREVNRGVHAHRVFPAIVADCCETFSVFCSLAFSSVSSQREIIRLLKTSALDWWLHTASWLHELTKSRWKYDFKTKQRPTVSEVVKCLSLDSFFPGNDLRSENFTIVMYHQVEKALGLVRELRDYLDHKKEQLKRSSLAEANPKQRTKRGREYEVDSAKHHTKGFVIVSGDYTVSVFAILPDQDNENGALGILDSHGSFPWSDCATCLSTFEDVVEARTRIGGTEVGDDDHFCRVLFSLLEENRAKDFSPHSPLLRASQPPPHDDGNKEEGDRQPEKVVALAIDSEDDEVQEVVIKVDEGSKTRRQGGGLNKHSMTWTPIYDVPKQGGEATERYFPPLKSEEVVFLAKKCTRRFVENPDVAKNLKRQAPWLSRFPYEYMAKGIGDSYLAETGANKGSRASTGSKKA